VASGSVPRATERSEPGEDRPAYEWLRFGAVIAARAALSLILGLTFWAVAPLAIGWQTTTVMTGSMAPAIDPGDLVVSRPADPTDLRVGQVLLFDDPDHDGELRLHRLHALEGTELVPKGDANPHADSTPVDRADVLGVGILRVPWIGSPIRDVREGDALPLAATLVGVSLAAAVALAPATRRRESDPPSSAPSADAAPGGGDRSPGIFRRRAALAVAALFSAIALSPLGATTPAYAAPFSATTAAPGSLQAATAQAPYDLGCESNLDGTATIRWSYASDRPTGFDVVIDGRGSVATLGPDARSITLRANTPFSFGRTSVVRVRTNLTQNWTATTASAVNVTTTTFLWVGVARCG